MNVVFKINKSLEDVNIAVKIKESMECFATLRKKPFTIIPTCLLQSINQELTGSARAIYFHIYGQAEKNLNMHGRVLPVIISAKTLAEYHIFKSERTIQRRLAELEAKGYIFLQQRFNKKTGFQQSNAVWLSFPEHLRQRIEKIPDRGPTVKVILPVTRVIDDNLSVYNNESVINNGPVVPRENKTEPVLINTVIKAKSNSEVNNSQQLAYEHYIKLVAELRAQGMHVAKANMKAYRMLNKEMQKNFILYLEEQKNIEKNVDQTEQICVLNADKNVVHKIYNNNYIVNSKTPVDNQAWQWQNKYILWPEPKIVNLNKKITPEFIEKQIKKMQEQIPNMVFNNGKSIADIVLEVQFHVENRDLSKTKTALHALNAAKGMLKKGLWQTPIRYIYAKNNEAMQRERLAQQEKTQELFELRRFLNNK